MNLYFMDLKEVSHIVKFKKTTIYKWMRSGDFPKPIKIGRSVRWASIDIEEWMKKQIKSKE